MRRTMYTTTLVSSTGKPLAGTFERKYRALSEAQAAEVAASNWMTIERYSAALVVHRDGVWTFTPATGSPVHIRVTKTPPTD